MHAVDTNVLVRLFVQDDERQLAAAREFMSRGIWISHVVLVEAMWVLAKGYAQSHAQIASTIEMLLKEKHVSIQDADVVEAALGHYRRRPSLGFTDCLVVEIARKAGHLPLGTFDRNLGKLEGAQRL